jgi:hypothetical protein
VHQKCRDANVDCIFVKPVKKIHLSGVLDAHFEKSTRGLGMLSGLMGGAHMDGNRIADAKGMSAFTAGLTVLCSLVSSSSCNGC